MNDPRDNADPHGPDRRDFLQTAGLVGAGLALSESMLPAAVPPQLAGELWDAVGRVVEGPPRVHLRWGD